MISLSNTPRPRITAVVSYFRDGSSYPRSGPERTRHDMYWANIAVNAATFRRVAGESDEFIVYTGAPPSPDTQAVLDAAHATVRILPFSRRPREEFYHRYVGSLYVLDCMEDLANRVEPDGVVMLVDPDVVWALPPGPLVAEICRGGIVGYDLDVPESMLMCHLDRRRQAQILGEMTGNGPEVFTHFGGEFYGMTGKVLREVVAEIEPLWEATLARDLAGQDHYNVEEHVMNAVMWQRGEQNGRANPFIQRIRTLPPPFGTRERMHDGLVIWHLPKEKDRAFMSLFRRLRRGRPLPPIEHDYHRWLARRMGIHPYGFRWIADQGRVAKWAVTGKNRATSSGL